MIPRYRSQTPTGKRKEDRENNVDRLGQDQAAPDRAQAREAGEREGSYRSSTTVAGRAKSKESEEEPSEGKKKEKENKAIDSRCKVDICKSISTLLYSKSRLEYMSAVVHGTVPTCLTKTIKENSRNPFQCTPFLHTMVIQWESFPSTSVDSLGYLADQILFLTTCNRD